jgi:hypothetical protein
VTTAIVVTQRTSPAIMYPITMPMRFGAASISRLMKPVSQSRAMPNPVNTPENAAD